ncbi:hypothetical protein ACWXVL_00275 [Mycoplasma sp. 128]|uniref:hypothetical protein n=1 Tax=Mycoplasma sp. 3341 TaxID=3447506 RepID=UPI003F6595EA
MFFINKALIPLFNKPHHFVLLYKNPEIAVWTQLYRKDAFDKKPEWTTLEEFVPNASQYDKENFTNFYIDPSFFFVSGSEIFDKTIYPDNDWDFKKEENNYIGSQLVVELMRSFLNSLAENEPSGCIVFYEQDVQSKQFEIRPYYMCINVELAQRDRQEIENQTEDNKEIFTKFLDQVFEKEIVSANEIWQTNPNVQTYKARLKLYTQHFIKIAQKTVK